MKTSDRFKCALAALAFCHGCATLPPDASVASRQGVIPEGNGVVIAETLNNSRRITSFVEHWKELILWRQHDEGEDQTQWISALDQSHSTQAYMGVVPAGTYRIGLLFAQEKVGDITYSARALVPPALGTFEVRAGQATNLGTILYHPFQARHRAEEAYPDYALTRIANDGLVRLAHTLHPEIMAQIDGAPDAGPNAIAQPRARGPGLALLRHISVWLATQCFAMADGAFSHLGTGLEVAVYSPSTSGRQAERGRNTKTNPQGGET